MEPVGMGVLADTYRLANAQTGHPNFAPVAAVSMDANLSKITAKRSAFRVAKKRN
jgi:hypothetical protein